MRGDNTTSRRRDGKCEGGHDQDSFRHFSEVSKEEARKVQRERRSTSRSVILIVLLILPSGLAVNFLFRGRGGSPSLSPSSPLSSPGKVIAPEQVFMAVKTTPKNYHTRVQSILDTFWNLAPRSVVFFTDSSSEPELELMGLQNPWQLRQMEDPLIQDPTKDRFNLIDTGCGGSHSSPDLRCKTAAEIKYFAKHAMESAAWFCQFDDDTFVNVPNLVSYLGTYDADSELLYVGRRVNVSDSYCFAPGSAWCLSRALVHHGRSLFENLVKVSRGADDTAIGYLVHKKLNVTMVHEPRMHSHLEGQKFTSQSDMQEQLTYGAGGSGRFRFPSYPGVRFVGEKGGPPEDPMGFRALFCNLWRDRCMLTNNS